MDLNKTQKRIIELLFLKRSASKKELSREMNLSQAALTLSSKPLMEEGYLFSEGKKSSGRAGRSEELLSLNPSYGYFLGVDVKKTSITLTEMNFAGNLLLEEKFHDDHAIYQRLKEETDAKKVLGLGVTYRKNLFPFQYEGLISKLDNLPIPHIFFVNNVEALASSYHFLHQEEKNFLLIKYGPGLGSCIYVNGEPIKRQNGTRSEIGHAYLSNGSKLEDVVSFDTLLGKTVEEAEGAEELFQNKEKLSIALSTIALSLLDADALLALDQIVFAGVLLSKQEVIGRILQLILQYNPEFNINKISVYPDYAVNNSKKATLHSFIQLFC